VSHGQQAYGELSQEVEQRRERFEGRAAPGVRRARGKTVRHERRTALSIAPGMTTSLQHGDLTRFSSTSTPVTGMVCVDAPRS